MWSSQKWGSLIRHSFHFDWDRSLHCALEQDEPWRWGVLQESPFQSAGSQSQPSVPSDWGVEMNITFPLLRNQRLAASGLFADGSTHMAQKEAGLPKRESCTSGKTASHSKVHKRNHYPAAVCTSLCCQGFPNQKNCAQLFIYTYTTGSQEYTK